MKKKQRLVAALCAAAVTATALSTFTSFSAAEPKAVEFDESNIVLRFGAISDIHLGDGHAEQHRANFDRALKTFVNIVGDNKLDAITISGDFLDHGSEDEEIEAKSVLDQYLDPNETELVMTIGNHEDYGSEGRYDGGNNGFKQGVLSSYTYKNPVSGNTEAEILNGNYHTVLNGIHFISVRGVDGNHSDANLNWLDKQLEIAAKDPDAQGKPIYVLTHVHPTNTNYGSQSSLGSRWNSTTIGPHLAKYPQVVVFSGHTHFPVHDERSIDQQQFTAINTGSVGYMSLDNNYYETPGDSTYEFYDSHKVSTGHYVEVDANGTTRVTRYSFQDEGQELGVQIKEPWVFPAAQSTDDFVYTDARKTVNNEAPYFEEGRKNIEVKNFNNLLDIVTFDVAYDSGLDDDMVHHYEIEVKEQGENGEVLSNVKTFSPFYLYPNPADTPKQVFERTGFSASGLKPATNYEINVHAVDSFGNRSVPLTYNFTTENYAANPLLSYKYKPIVDFNYLPIQEGSFGLDKENADPYFAYNTAVEQNKLGIFATDSLAMVGSNQAGALQGKAMYTKSVSNGARKIVINAANANNPAYGKGTDDFEFISFYVDTNDYSARTMLLEFGFTEQDYNTDGTVSDQTTSYNVKESAPVILAADGSFNTILAQAKGRISIPKDWRGTVMIPKDAFEVTAGTDANGKIDGKNIQEFYFNYSTGTANSVVVIDEVGFLVDSAQEGAVDYPAITSYTLGDINADDSIDVVDALLALQHSVGLKVLSPVEQLAGDVEQNGSVTVTDALQILRYSVGLITEFTPVTVLD